MPTGEPTTQIPASHYVFYLGPFRFESEFDLRELHASTGQGEIAVSIHLGGVPDAIPGAITVDQHCQVAPAEYLLTIPGVARYYVRNGSEVRIEIVPGTPPANVSTYLLGSVFGVLCHQNGLLPLHGSAVEQAGAVTAFLGDSGAGKSTLAACLHRRGHSVVSDDICLLESTPGAMRVIPVAGWLKLWNQSLEHLGETPVEQNRVFSTDDKFRLFLPNSTSDAAQPRAHLARVVFLAKAPDPQAQPTLQRLPLLDAIAGLMEMTYVGYVPAHAGQQSTLFQQCAQVFRHAQAWRLTLPWDLARIDSVLDLLQREFFQSLDAKP